MDKCIVFFNLFLCTFITTVSAQTNVTYGAKVGVTLSTISKAAEPVIIPKPVAGFYLGGFARINLHEKVAFQPELLLSAQGYKDDYKSRNGEAYSLLDNIRTTWYYLNVPLLVRYAVTDLISLKAGPQVGYQLSSNSKLNYATEELSLPGDVTMTQLMRTDLPQQGGGGATNPPLSGGLNRFDLGVAVGAEYQIKSNWSGHIRYTHGISDAQKSTLLQVKNRVFMLGVSYLISM